MDGLEASSQTQRLPLQERLQEPQTELILHRLLDRLDGIERSLEQLAQLNQGAPAFAATFADSVDGMVQKLQRQGIDVNERLANGLGLLDKLSSNETMAVLNQLLSRMDRLELSLQLLDSLPQALAAMGDTADDLMGRLQRRGIDVNERASASLELLEKLSEPKILASLGHLVSKLDSLNPLMDLAEQAPALASIAMDSLDGMVEKAKRAGIDISGTLTALMDLASKLGPEQINALSGLMKGSSLEQLSAMADALETTNHQPIKQLGPLGMLAEMRDPDVQRALGFFLGFAKQFGAALKK